MRLTLTAEERLFAESVRAAIGGWQPAREPDLGAWLDDRDDALAERLAAAGWTELWNDASLLGVAVAGGVELGRAAAPVCLVDEPTLGGALAVSDRARHGARARRVAVPLRGGGLGLADTQGGEPEPTLDGSGTLRVPTDVVEDLRQADADARWQAWTSVTLAYLGGLAARALERSVEHARTREQFGAPLAALPAVQARLADASLAADSLELLAVASVDREGGVDAPALVWAGDACCRVTASAHQVHGAVGFALESGLHVYQRRARSMQAWAAAVCAALR
jgi:hypothetical protein